MAYWKHKIDLSDLREQYGKRELSAAEFDGKSDEDKHHLIDVEIAHRKDANEQVWKGLEEEIGQQVSDKIQEKLQEVIEEIQNVSLDAE